MRNQKMSTVITAVVSLVSALCILFLFVTASNNMTDAMRSTAMNNMETSLNARTALIEQYVAPAAAASSAVPSVELLSYT